MPTFDRSSSKPRRSEADLLRGVLGPARPRETSLRAASRTYQRAHRRSMVRRTTIVAVLLAAFLGSASLMSQKQPATTTAVANRTFADPVTTGSIRPVIRPAPLSSGGPPDEETAENRP